MPDGLLWATVLSSSHCVCTPNVRACFPLLHCRLSTSVNAFGVTIWDASDAPFSVHGDRPEGKSVVVPKEEPGKLSEACPAGRPPIPTSGPPRYGAKLSVGANTGWGKRVNPYLNWLTMCGVMMYWCSKIKSVGEMIELSLAVYGKGRLAP